MEFVTQHFIETLKFTYILLCSFHVDRSYLHVCKLFNILWVWQYVDEGHFYLIHTFFFVNLLETDICRSSQTRFMFGFFFARLFFCHVSRVSFLFSIPDQNTDIHTMISTERENFYMVMEDLSCINTNHTHRLKEFIENAALKKAGSIEWLLHKQGTS